MQKDSSILQYLYYPAEENPTEKFYLTKYGTPENPMLRQFSYYDIYLIRSGRITAVTEDTRTNFKGPCLIIYNKNRLHCQYAHSDTTYDQYMIRTRNTSDPELQSIYREITNKIKNSITIIPLSNNRVDWLFQICNRLIYLLCDKKIPRSEERILIPFRYLMKEILYSLNKPSTHDDVNTPSYIGQALDFIKDHLTEKISITEIANHVNIGKTKLCTDFKKHLLTTIHQYITRERLELAKQYLDDGHSVNETAFLCGFSDSAHFIHTFQKYFQIAPTQYKSTS